MEAVKQEIVFVGEEMERKECAASTGRNEGFGIEQRGFGIGYVLFGLV